MLSILIPTYNYNVFPLVNELHVQGKLLSQRFEILVLDDGSTNLHIENEKINSLKNASFKKLEENIGRSAIRNLLAKKAIYETLLFLDADTRLIKENFISTYLQKLNSKSQIIYGGIVYQKEKPPKDQVLRWHYGNKREALLSSERNKAPHLRFLTLNFLVKKNVFDLIQFNEEIPNLRHEDTLFALYAKDKNINVDHIDNPVMHMGIETSIEFLEKSLESVQALSLFISEGLVQSESVKLSQKAIQIKRMHLDKPILLIYKVFSKKIRNNLLSSNPSLFWFDIYRLGYFLELKPKSNA